jgi:hypothetical protein
MAKVAFNKKKTFYQQIDLKCKGKKTVKCYVWNTDLYGAETYDTSENCSETTWQF